MNRARLILVSVFIVGIGTIAWNMPRPSTNSAAAKTMPVAVPAPPLRPSPAFDAQVIADKLVAPWAIGFLPDGRILFTERQGRVRIIKDDALQPEPALVASDLKVWVKMGLLGLAIDPDFTRNHFVYLAQCYGSQQERDSWVRVVRYELRGEKLESPTTLIEGIPAFLNHAGGRLAFGPDGKLYITTGDADRPAIAQDLNSLGGKILRINPDGSIPADNPFVNQPLAQPAIWTYGHRNSQGLAFQPTTGRLFISEHGPNGGDEVNVIQRGANYGWPTVSHDRVAEGMTPSLAEYSPAIGPGDATFYSGNEFPELNGDLLVACMRGEALLRITLDERGEKIVHTERLIYQKFGRIREVSVAPDGAIWITTSEVDPPEGRNRENYDQVIRLSRGIGTANATQLPDANLMPRPVGAVAIYAANCVTCHGQSSARALSSSLFDRKWEFGSANDDDLRRIIRTGIQERGMPSFEKILTRDEIDEVIRLIRIREQEYRG